MRMPSHTALMFSMILSRRDALGRVGRRALRSAFFADSRTPEQDDSSYRR
jgi:hypothetical protein